MSAAQAHRFLRRAHRRQLPQKLLLPVVALTIVLVLWTGSGKTDDELRQIVERTTQIVDGRRVVLVTAVNYAFREYLLNFNCSLQAAQREMVPLVISMDEEMHAWAVERGFESLFLPLEGKVAGGDVHMFGSKGFNLLSKQKLYAVYKVLQTGVDVLFSDADIVWCGDAVGEVVKVMYETEWKKDGISRRMPHLLMQTAWPRSLLNSGFYYARAGGETLSAFEAFLRFDGDSENDQVIVNRVMCRRHGNGDTILNGTFVHPAAPHRAMPALCRWDGRVEARLLDAARFPTGGEVRDGVKIFHLKRRQIVSMCEGGDVAVLHNNCILSSKKRARFIVKGIWYVGENACLKEAAPATFAMRKQCGGAKCGPEGDVRRYPNLVVR